MSPDWRQITLLAMAGGLLGVLAMVPLRRYLIKQEHGTLPYPEGMACAEVLVAAEHGGRQAAPVFQGIAAGMGFKLLTDGLKLVAGKFNLALPFKAELAVSVSPALIGVGYILGPKIGSVMVAGSGRRVATLAAPGAISALRCGAESSLTQTFSSLSSAHTWSRIAGSNGSGSCSVRTAKKNERLHDRSL